MKLKVKTKMAALAEAKRLELTSPTSGKRPSIEDDDIQEIVLDVNPGKAVAPRYETPSAVSSKALKPFLMPCDGPLSRSFPRRVRVLRTRILQPSGDTLWGLIEIGLEVGKYVLDMFRAPGKAMRQRWFFGVPVGEKVWKPPIEGIYRIDVDACFDLAMSLFGVGIVIRDDSGGVSAAMALSIASPSSVSEADLIALMYGAGLGLQEGLGHEVEKMTKG